MEQYEYLIVGAGPAGLQMAYFLGTAGRDYLVLEAADSAGSFFRQYPRHRRLLSINKRFNLFPEPDFNLRHDWNSLLSDDPALLFTRYSAELYPSADALYRYLNDFAARFHIHVRYNTAVCRVERDGYGRFLIWDEAGATYMCDRLLMATGAVAPYIPSDIEGIEHAVGYENHDLNQRTYEQKTVAIIGRGNSAFEVANHLAGHAAVIHLLVRGRARHAWETHYPGDLRAVNDDVLDMYQLKSLHATIGIRPTRIVTRESGTITVFAEEDCPHWETPGMLRIRMLYDHVIRCTGWRYVDPEIFDSSCTPGLNADGKFPKLGVTWEATVPGLYYIGTAMQSRDRRTASGFIHGFRYNIRTLFRLLEEKYHGVALPSRAFKLRDEEDLDWMAKSVALRVSTTSALYQLFGFLCDVIIFANDQVTMFQELPVDYVLQCDSITDQEHFVLLTLEYGFDRYPDHRSTLDFVHPADAARTSCSAFLHPVFRHYSKGAIVEEYHLAESLVVRYERPGQVNMIKNFLNRVVRVTHAVFWEEPYSQEGFSPWSSEADGSAKPSVQGPSMRCTPGLVPVPDRQALASAHSNAQPFALNQGT
jgi:thioredoxin reductase